VGAAQPALRIGPINNSAGVIDDLRVEVEPFVIQAGRFQAILVRVIKPADRMVNHIPFKNASAYGGQLVADVIQDSLRQRVDVLRVTPGIVAAPGGPGKIMAPRGQVVGIQPIERLTGLRPIETRSPQPDPRRVFQIVLEYDLIEVLDQFLPELRAVGRRVVDPAGWHGCAEAEAVLLHFHVHIGRGHYLT
jgi:hypothetical protein